MGPEMGGGRGVASVVQDVRYALRRLRRDKAASAATILTLALGIGAVTGIFSVTDAVLFRPLPFPAPHRLVTFEVSFRSAAVPPSQVLSYPQVVDLRDRAGTFDAVAAYTPAAPLRTGDDREVTAAYASTSLFPMLGASTSVGRLPDSRDGQSGATPVAVISQDAWIGRFGADARVIGRVLHRRSATTGGDEAVRIVGVLAQSFVFPYPRGPVEVDAWMPLTPDATVQPGAIPRASARWLVIARLKEGLSVAAAADRLAALSASLRQAYPDTDRDKDLRVVSLHAKIVGSSGRPLLVFLGGVAFLLLIACANVAGLLLARAGSRQQEIGVRLALGAGRGRVARQLLTETAVLALLGGAAGLAFAWWTCRAFVAFAPPIPRLDEAALDYRVLGFALVVITLTTLAAGLVPAMQGSGKDVAAALGGAGTRTATRRSSRSRSVLVAVELAVALALSSGAGLMVNSFVRLVRFDLGMDPTSVVAFELRPPRVRMTPDWKAAFDEERRTGVAVLTAASRQQAALDDEVVRQVSALPGVTAVGATSDYPLSGLGGKTGVKIAGSPIVSAAESAMVDVRRVSPGYFRALGIRMKRGRGFTADDRQGAALVAVVNATMATRFWAGTTAIDQSVSIGSRGPFRVVGIIHDVRQNGATEPASPEIYVPAAQDPRSWVLLAKLATPAAVNEIEAELKRGNVPLVRVRRLEGLLSERLAASRFSTFLLVAFSLVALVLALLGVHGVLSAIVAQRTREIGVRMALGANRRSVMRLVLVPAVGCAVAGLCSGIVVAWALARLLRTMLFEIGPSDPLTLGLVAAAFLVTVSVAAYVPARRATAVDPVSVLRCE